MRSLCVIVALVAANVACWLPEDRARAGFRARLMKSERLSDQELWRLAQLAVEAIGDKSARAQADGISRPLESRERAAAFALLAGDIPLEDAGVRASGNTTLRGLSGPGTPIRSEIDAQQTLWIDVDTFLPRRYELTFSLAGQGDSAYDLMFTP
jgi:hypothetical protein